MPKSSIVNRRPSIIRGLPFRFLIRECPFREYKALAQFHYRPGHPGPVKHTFGLYVQPDRDRTIPSERLVGIIVYSMPPLNSHLRNLATNYRYPAVTDPAARARLINCEVRTISRVVIHPQFRSCSLAVKLVKKTLPLPRTLFIEAAAAMGQFNPFFQKAGMKRFSAPHDLDHERLTAAFDHIGITPEQLLDTKHTIATINNLTPPNKRFIVTQIQNYFLQRRRATFTSNIPNTLEWIIPRLAYAALQRPTYFLWQNPTHKPKIR